MTSKSESHAHSPHSHSHLKGNEQADFDLFSAEFKRDPFPTYAQLRAEHPVYCHIAPYGARIWYITRYADVVAVLKDNGRFAKDPRAVAPEEDVHSGGRKISQMINRNMLFADPPDHTRLRALVSQAFTPRRIENMAPRITTLVDELLDAAVPETPFDFISRFALPLPMSVIMELLGIPLADQARVYDWTKAIISPGQHGISLRKRRQNVTRFVAYLEQMFAARRADPQDDLISDLVRAEEAGDRLSEAELSSMVALLFVTGHETVVNLLGNGLLALLRHPAALQRLRHEPALFPQALEELLRFDGPVETSTTRWAREDVVLHGQHIRRGDVVRVVITAANRDPEQFADPDELNFERESNPHLQFGYGIHYCLGAPLARLEGKIVFERLLARFRKIELAIPEEELVWHTGVLFRGLKALPVTLTP